MKLFGGAYLVYLGIRLIRTKAEKASEERVPHETNANLRKNYKFGLFTSLSKPKTAALVASLFAAAMPANASWDMGIFSVALMAGISVIWYLLVAYIFSLNRFRRLYQRLRVWIERIAGAVFIGFGARLAASE